MAGKKRLFLIISKQLIAAVVAVVVAGVAVAFLKNKIEKIGDSLVEKKKAALVLEKRGEVLSRLSEDMKIVDGHDKAIENALPPVSDISDFITALDNLFAGSQEQHTVSFSDPVLVTTLPSGTRLYSVNFSLTLGGNVFTLSNFLRDFDKLPYFTAITGVNLNAPADRGWDGPSSIAVQGVFYAK